ncbi:MAG: DUF4105 domain-containing protein [Alphaproteobacteria bacterium]|nr:DUF4105 domain-containing protein [Alphaproteobacteria bacterium]
MRQFFLFLFFIPSISFGSLDSALKSAIDQKLSQYPQWQTLLHFKGGTSTIDSKGFFLSESGKTDAEAELLATLQAFAQPSQIEVEEVVSIREGITQTIIHQHPQCQFKARYEWLKTQLDLSFIQEQKCPAYNKWIQKTQPYQATLVFASAYLNQPSSLFGHTFLRFDRKDSTEDLLSYISNFGAITPENPNGFAYAYNGLTGGYPGVFSFEPYYKKVKAYGALENRDLWEYHLNLSSSETQRLADHIWELGYQYVDYYFFTDNCSYLLMELLDVARPSLQLSKKFPLQTIPLDTVRAVLNKKDLTSDIAFRESLQTKILQNWATLSEKEKEAIHAFRDDNSLPNDLSLQEQARVSEVTYDVLQYDLSKSKLSLEDYQKKSFQLLRLRNHLSDVETDFPDIIRPPAPEEAHLPKRFDLVYGFKDRKRFLALHLRPAYHTIEDPDRGHIQGAGIDFFSGELRYTEEDDFLIPHFNLVSIQSLSPWQATFTPLSWKLGVNLTHRPTDFDRTMGNAFGALGLTQKLSDSLLTYQFVEGQLSYADKTLSSEISPALSGSMGWVYTSDTFFKWLGEIRYRSFLNEKEWAFWEFDSQLILYEQKNSAGFIRYHFYDNEYLRYNETSFGIRIYF